MTWFRLRALRAVISSAVMTEMDCGVSMIGVSVLVPEALTPATKPCTGLKPALDPRLHVHFGQDHRRRRRRGGRPVLRQARMC
jgi:hypothetical protein